jgi:arsenite methyltransferase
VSGALAERVFVEKLKRVGFADIEIVHREPFGVDEAELYPLFTGDLIEVMRKVIPADKQHEVATSVVVKAHLRADSKRTRD